MIFSGYPPALQTRWKVVSDLLSDSVIKLHAGLEGEHLAPKHQVERQ
jgi:hypothetical protein